jgi:hypothetical protein
MLKSSPIISKDLSAKLLTGEENLKVKNDMPSLRGDLQVEADQL